jgi:hypothetical protein
MSNQAMEDVIELVKSAISDNMETYLTAVESARSVTIPRHKSLDTGILYSHQYPAIEVLPGSTDTDYSDTPESYLHEHWNVYEVGIHVAYPFGDHQEAMYVLMRYDEALEELFKANYTLSDSVEIVRIAGSDFAGVVEAQRDKQLLQVLVKELQVLDESI